MATIPSIAMIPSGVKASKLYSVLPTDGTGDFTTTRASVATRVNENGLIEEVAANVPRLDYSDGTCPSLLLEPTATNIITYSEDFSNVAWIKTGVSLTSGFVSPDGTTNAFKLVEDTSNSSHRVYKTGLSNGASASKEFTYSIFVKKSEVNWFLLKTVINGQSVTVNVWFDLVNGVLGTQTNGTGKIESYGNDWYKCSINITTDATATSLNTYGYLADGNNSENYVGDGTSGVYIFGAQLEENSYATSYIPTQGTTQTRVADTATGSGSSTVINSTEGVLYAEISALSNATSVRGISLSDGSSDNRVYIHFTSDTNIRTQVRVGGVNQVVINSTQTLTNLNKIAFVFKQDDFALWINGVEVAIDTSGNTYSSNTLTVLSFDDGGGGNNFYGKVKSLQVYTTALSDAELTSLTTI